MMGQSLVPYLRGENPVLDRDPDELDNLADDADDVARPLAELERFIDVHRLRRPGYRPPLVR